jgi:aryl-alcohol dehydrogenase-like predicted oxidoreductase
MEYRNLGNSGLQVSIAGLGCNNFGMRIDEAETQTVVDAAIDAGITFFDTADVYGGTKSEEFLGRALGSRRHDVVIATKFAMPLGEGPYKRGGSRHYIYKTVEDSLRRLGTDYIDLYQMHQPDSSTPIDETLRALDDLVREGKIRYLGNSNFSGWQIADADWTARDGHLTRFVSAQNEWSLLSRTVEHEVIPACDRFGLGQLPFFPLASGFLTGKYRRGEDLPEGTRLAAWAKAMPDRIAAQTSDANWDKLEGLTKFAEDRGHNILTLALCWLATSPVVSSVIAGATKVEQITGNVEATNAWRLSDQEMAEVDTILKG